MPTPNAKTQVAQSETPARYTRIGDMTWPKVDDDLMWRLRYAQESISERDKFYLASVSDDYKELIRCNREKRETVCRAIREGQ